MKRLAISPADLILWLILIGGNYGLYLLALPIRVGHHALLTAVLVGWLWRRGLPDTPLLAPLLGVLGAVLLSALSAADPRMAFEHAWFWLNHALLFLWLIDALRRGEETALWRALFACGAFIVVGGLVSAALGQVRPAGVLLFINLAGSFAGLIAVLAFGWSIGAVDLMETAPGRLQQTIRRHYIAHGLYLALAFASVAFVIVNQSRGGLLAIGAGVLAFTMLEFKLSRRAGLIALPFLLIAALLSLTRVSGDLHRLDIWRSAVLMFADQPLTGVGVGLFGQTYLNYRRLPFDYIAGAHNLPLNMAAELGAPGIMAGLVLIVVFAVLLPARRTLRQNVALSGLIGAAANALFDTQLATAYVIVVMLCAAYLVYPQWSTLISAPRLRWLGRAAVITLLIAALGLARADIAQLYYQRGLSGDVHAAQLAYAIDPLPLYQLQVQQLTAPASVAMLLDWRGITSRTHYALSNYARYWQ